MFGKRKQVEELPDDDMDGTFNDGKPNWVAREKIN